MSYLKTDQTSKKTKTLSRTGLNKKANHKLKKYWEKNGINSCEICGSTFNLTNMHRYKRRWFYDKPDSYLWNPKFVIRACLKCHMKYEYNKNKTEKIFKKLRQ